MGEVDGVKGAWGYPEGGMGAVSGAIARSALESGAEIVTESPVRRIVIDNGKTEGVQLENGKVIKAKVDIQISPLEISRRHSTC